MRTLPRREYSIEVSVLGAKIFDDACRPWGIWCGFGGPRGCHIFLSKNETDIAIRALKMHQVEYPSMSKNRKRVKELIRQIEQARSPYNDK